MIELEAQPSREERDDELVEADPLALGLFDELDVQAEGHAHEDSSAGFHTTDDITGAIDNGDSACDIATMTTSGIQQMIDRENRRAQFFTAQAIERNLPDPFDVPDDDEESDAEA